jgi:1-aminocyclopropane-1-carboxylate deaminase/D-cysteine desulfhydrase-like pyridoxal-dependent ACC family enzyme
LQPRLPVGVGGGRPRCRGQLDAFGDLCVDARSVFPEPSFPTPVRACPELSTARAELWLKNDGPSHPLYGGTKVRKAALLLAEAMRRRARRLFSFGAAGSHHLLTLALFARQAELESAAVVIAQPRSLHALDTLRAALGLGLRVYPASHSLLVPWALTRALRSGDYVIPPGGSNVLGARACAQAIDELALQIESGALPMPDWIVVPLGSGGTCGGLAAGVIRRGLSCRVLGVQVVSGIAPRAAARFLAREVLRSTGQAQLANALGAQLAFDSSQVGAGYGFATPAGARATELARAIGLELDQTYTAKAFASALELLSGSSRFAEAEFERPLRVLYWHTLADTDLAPLLVGAPARDAVPASIAKLLR